MRDSEDWETVSDGKNDTEMTEACDLSRGVDTKVRT